MHFTCLSVGLLNIVLAFFFWDTILSNQLNYAETCFTDLLGQVQSKF